MANTFLISDTHFGHANMCNFVDDNGDYIRPWRDVVEMDEALIENWNKVVAPCDRVYHLGDVAIPRKSLSILSRLNGKKVLIRGNHDIFKLSDYSPYFYDIRGVGYYDNFVMTHVPIHPGCIERYSGNIHGHLHGRVVMLDEKPDCRYFNVSVERINFTPIPFDSIKTYFTKGHDLHKNDRKPGSMDDAKRRNTIRPYRSTN